jgi:hypothetical protein
MNDQSVKYSVSEEEKFVLRMKLTHEQRFRAFMKVSRFKAKLKNAKIVKPD